MMRSAFLLVFCCFSISLFSQDQHFTQFYASPVSLNPALTGVFPGKYRVSFIYRDQWRRVLDKPYVTFSGAADFRFGLSRLKGASKNFAGAGVLFYNDKVSDIGFSTNHIVVSGAFHKALGKYEDQYLSVGYQIGVAQRNINYDKLTFNDQFNGTDGYTGSTDEVLPENNFAFSDMNIGLNYTYAPERKMGVFAGVALHHITEPAVGFYYDAENPDRYAQDYLYRKYTAHVGLQIPAGDNVQFIPRVLYYKQGPHTAINAGSNVRFLVSEISGNAIHLGGWARLATSDDNKTMVSSAIAMLGIELGNFLIGFSYDANLSGYIQTSRGQGAFELSIAYLGEYEDDTVLCPQF